MGFACGPKSRLSGPDISFVAISAITNLASLASYAALNRASMALYKSMERLSTGKKINRASDDPAGAAAVDQMKVKLTTIHRRIDTIDFQERYLGARDGAESAVSDLLLQLKTDVTAAANTSGLTDEEKQAYQEDASSILKTLDHLSQTTTFDGQQILTNYGSGQLGGRAVVRPADPNNPNQPPGFYTILDLAEGGKLNLVDGDLESAQKVVDAAVSSVAGDRAAIGIELKSMDTERSGLLTEMENTEAARSMIEDTDYAEETSNLVRAQVLREASLYVLQLAGKQHADTVLSLLKQQ
jgi:flagellin